MELAKKYAVPETILEKLVRDEAERSQPPGSTTSNTMCSCRKRLIS
jgi:hypothetical protein